jgi:6-phospho-3-hexuloisomerase
VDGGSAGQSETWHRIVGEIAAAVARVDPAALTRLVGVLADRERRWFYTGQGRSGRVAEMVAMRAMHLGYTCHVVGDATTPAIGPGDGLMAISGSGTTGATTSHLGVARARGAEVVVVTRRAGTPATNDADHVVVLPAPSSWQLGGNLFEQTALIVLDGALCRVAAGDPDAADRLRALHANLQ